MKADIAVFDAFLATLPRGVQVAFEFRHDSWFADDVFACLRQHNRALCIAETEERTTPDVTTADFAYYRYRKPEYTADERATMLHRMRDHLSAGRDVFAYFKHEETPQHPRDHFPQRPITGILDECLRKMLFRIFSIT
jgi:uncharacterized protein YecE (DUF72 family)